MFREYRGQLSIWLKPPSDGFRYLIWTSRDIRELLLQRGVINHAPGACTYRGHNMSPRYFLGLAPQGPLQPEVRISSQPDATGPVHNDASAARNL